MLNHIDAVLSLQNFSCQMIIYCMREIQTYLDTGQSLSLFLTNGVMFLSLIKSRDVRKLTAHLDKVNGHFVLSCHVKWPCLIVTFKLGVALNLRGEIEGPLLL